MPVAPYNARNADDEHRLQNRRPYHQTQQGYGAEAIDIRQDVQLPGWS